MGSGGWAFDCRNSRPPNSRTPKVTRHARLGRGTHFSLDHIVTGFNGTLCEEVFDACASVVCHHGQCVDTGDDVRCRCDAGFTGQYCDVELNECLSSPCRHGGTCRDLLNGFRCRCPAGTSGTIDQIYCCKRVWISYVDVYLG